MLDRVVFNRKTGQLGLQKCLGEAGFKDKEWGDGTKPWNSNYAVFILDPINFTWNYKNREYATTDWTPLPKNDPRVQFMALLDAIESADWYYGIASIDENAKVDEAYIENPHEVFRRIKKIFELG